MNGKVQILGADGHPLRPSRPSFSALTGGSRVPYDAA